MANFTISANTKAGLGNVIENIGAFGTFPASGAQTASQFAISSMGLTLTFIGSSFSGYSGNRPTSGSIAQIELTDASAPGETATWTGFSLSMATLNAAIAANDSTALGNAMFGGADTITGAAGDDELAGYAGDDVIRGNGGGDDIDGGAGTDTAVYSGAYADYTVINLGSRTMVSDMRGSNADGTDFLTSIERLQFSDRTIDLTSGPAPVGSGSPGSAAAAVTTAWNNIMRTANAADLTTILGRVAQGSLTTQTAIGLMIASADSTTTVATMAYQFFTGKIPGAAGYDFLISPTANANSLNSPYYQTFNMENRYINFAVNLGKLGEGRAAFESQYGSLTLSAATKQAYGVIFGGTPTDAKVAALLAGGRDAYFAYYGGDGLTGIGTKAAMVGWLMAEAAKANVGMYSMASDAFLTDLADGAAYNVNLVGTYGQASFNYAG